MTKSIDTNTLIKLQRFCLYQHRCEQDIIKKLRQLKTPPSQDKKYLNALLREKYYDQLVFSNEVAYGKFTHNNWGKQKIRAALYGKQIDSHIIEEAMKSIANNDYKELALHLISKKLKSLQDKNDKDKFHKIYRFMIQRGFLSEDFMPILKSELE